MRRVNTATPILIPMTGLFFLFLIFSTTAQNVIKEKNHSGLPTEVLLAGTFHFHNPGADVAKTKSFDILSERAQNELEDISESITSYAPNKIFVEWDYRETPELDSLYQLYLKDRYFSQDSLSDFYKKNEIFQLAFRIAKKLDHDKVWAIDYRDTEFPFDSLMTVMAINDQKVLQQKFTDAIQRFTKEFDEKLDSGASLKELLYYLNGKDMRRLSNDLQTIWPLTAGDGENFIGPYLVSEWYRRNLYMWSLIKKYCAEDEGKIMILVGASHAAMIEKFILDDGKWRVVELKSTLNDE